jgi:hypothetical protein
MNADNHLWGFTSLVPEERRRRLLAVQSYDEVIEGIACGEVDYFNVESWHECSRAIFKLQVEDAVFDAFFNSPNRYRAQYCRGVENGEKQNRRLIEAITQACYEFAEQNRRQEFSGDRVLASLQGKDAKVWIPEDNLPDVEEVQIDYKPWVAKAEASSVGGSSGQAARSKASVGVLAPVGAHIEVKGAWLTPKGDEWRNPRKSHRGEEIRDYGFT